jgi:recombinational DNA repair protein RecT
MSNNLQIIADTLRDPRTTGRLTLALGYNDGANKEAKAEAAKYAASVLAELEKMANDDKKKDILLCSPQSIAQTMIDAAKFKIMIDGRQHAHIIKYGNTATLQIGYRGYIAKITENLDDADINVFPVYEGDTLNISDRNGIADYEYKKADAFAEEDKFKGICAVLSYRKGERVFQKIITLTKKEVMQIKGTAKQKFVWDAWFIEKAKVAAIKRICKVEFNSIKVLQEMISFDNQTHHTLDKPAEEVKAGSIVDNLNKAISPENIVEAEIIENAPQAEKDVLDYTPPLDD